MAYPTPVTSKKNRTGITSEKIVIGTLIKVVISVTVIVVVAELAGRFPRLGALLLTLPFISIMTWCTEGEMTTITQLARETLVLVPLGLPFFIPFALSDRTGLSFWSTLVVGILLATITIGLGPTQSTLFSKETCSISVSTEVTKSHD